jgi:4-hydroxy-tetrahydrodipicolinate synthase
VRLPVEFLAGLTEVLPPGSVIKLEDPPTATKTARVRSLAPGLPVFGGLGGVALLQELQAGAVGTMTGFACPELLVEIVESHEAGERSRAHAVFARALPLLVFEAQPGVGLGVRKEILRRRGAIVDATMRTPVAGLDQRTLASLDELLEALSAARP